MKVTIYSTPTCPFCKQAKAFFDVNKIAFIDIDVSADQGRAEEMIKKSGQMGVPVIEMGSDIVIGFDKKKIADLLKIA